ncbi:hypothetical protein WQ54_26825 [Bacillus sp. SA1-12]|uniref:hypothetical protein n=1 Tax=Bacillus sp. SA1-12 TaxID=1455638 RepID=UPI0006274686|nr:hypothetical protein [Bacillus sp. SA1-12]KKI89187.1 hypothetical protein WQ54_26825 [Bacillus sp. SA1-12]
MNFIRHYPSSFFKIIDYKPFNGTEVTVAQTSAFAAHVTEHSHRQFKTVKYCYKVVCWFEPKGWLGTATAIYFLYLLNE